jgi:virginiamycin B lyase
MWFAEGAAHAVGRSTKTGMITEYPLAPPKAMPVSLARIDPYIWITEQTGNQIIRMSATGEMTSYPLPTARAFPAHIVVGPDGALWFTENIANKIGRLAP